MRGITLQVAQREVGDLPISIPTSIALVALSDASNVTATHLYINLRTLFRNLNSACEPDVRHRADVVDYTHVLVEEVKFISTYIPSILNGRLAVVFYANDYSDIKRVLPAAKHRDLDDATEKQKLYHLIEMATVDAVTERCRAIDIPILRGHTELRSNREDAILISHSPIDLLYNNFRSLLLLESMTGAIKNKTLWGTKLTKGNQLPDMPFNKFTLQIFGDNNNYLYMQDRKIRNVVLSMAESDRWNNTTDLSRIRTSINRLRDPLARTLLTKIAKS